jgi:hypothetical protein
MHAVKKTADRRGQRVTRVEPPVLEEAVAAAQGLTDHIESQIEIAAQLMGLPENEVRPVVLKAASLVRRTERLPISDRNDGPKVVVVERKRSRLMTR